MGTTSAKFDTVGSEDIQQPDTISQAVVVYKDDSSAICLPTEMLLANPISVKEDKIIDYICNPRPPLSNIASFAIKQWEAGKAFIELLFEENVSVNEQERWTNMISPIVSAMCRELTDGKFFGVTADRNMLYFEPKACIFIRNREMLVSHLVSNVQNSLFEFVYSPSSISADEMKEMMKGFEPIREAVERQCGYQLGAIRKAGEFKTFSMLVALFSVDNLGDYLKHGRHFFSELLFSEELKDARNLIEEQLKAYAVRYTLPQSLTPLKLNFLSEIMSLENDRMKDYMLERSGGVSAFELDLARADTLYLEKCADLYAYVLANVPQVYKAQIQLIYSGKAADARQEVPHELIDQIVDQAIQQYVFDKEDIIDVDLKSFSARIAVEWLSQIAAQISEELLGEDNCTFGAGLDGEPFIRIFKVARQTI